MAIHLVVVAKAPLLHWFKFSPLLWPFNLYLPLSRRVCRMCDTLSTASSLLGFRLRRILAGGLNGEGRGLNRTERALRLFCRDVIDGPTHFPHHAIDQASLHVLHTVSL